MKIYCFYNCSYWTTDHQKMEIHYQNHHILAEIPVLNIEDLKLKIKEIKRLEKEICSKY